MNNNESIINLLKHQIIYKDTSQLITNQINTNRLTIKQEFLQDNYETIYLPDEVTILGKKKSVHRLYIKRVVKGNDVLFGGWICDNDIDSCMICNYMFNFIYRSKHHCRSCGNLVCTNCSPNSAIIQGLEDYHHQRVCVQCFWGQDIVFPIESMISNYIITNQSTSYESDDNNSIQFDLLDIYINNKSIRKKDSKLENQIDSNVDSKLDWKVSNYSDDKADSEIESYLLSDVTREYQNQLITNQLSIDSSINDSSKVDDKTIDKINSKVDINVGSKVNIKSVSQLDSKIDYKVDSQLSINADITIESNLNSPIDSELKDNTDNKLTVSSAIINNQIKRNPLLSNKSSIISRRLSSRTFSFTTVDSPSSSSNVSIESNDKVDSPIDSQYDSNIKLDDCIDISTFKLDDEIDSKLDGKADEEIVSTLDSKVYEILNNQLDSIIPNQVDSYTAAEEVINTVDSTIDDKINSTLDSKIESTVDINIVSTLDSEANDKVDSKIDSNEVSKVDSNIDSQFVSQLESQIDSKVDSNIENTQATNTHTYIYPLAGRVIKTKQIQPLIENSKLFINLCHHSIYPLNNTILSKVDSKINSLVDDTTIYLCDIKIWKNLNFRTIDVLIRTNSYELYLIDGEVEVKLNHLILSSIENRYDISLDHNISYPKTNNNYKGDIDELIMYINSTTHLSCEINRYDSYEDSKSNDMELENKIDSTIRDTPVNSNTVTNSDSRSTNRRESLIDKTVDSKLDSELSSEIDRGTFSRPSVIPKYVPSRENNNSLFRLSNNLSKIPNRLTNFLESNELIVYSSIVGKKSPIGLKLNQERELVLTNYPRLLYYDVRSNKSPRQILFPQVNKPIVDKVSNYIFQVKIFDPIVRVFEFTDRVNGSQVWVDHINNVMLMYS